jgi:hypothetical protein
VTALNNLIRDRMNHVDRLQSSSLSAFLADPGDDEDCWENDT